MRPQTRCEAAFAPSFWLVTTVLLILLTLHLCGCGGTEGCDADTTRHDEPPVSQPGEPTTPFNHESESYMSIIVNRSSDGYIANAMAIGPHAEFRTNLDPVIMLPGVAGHVWEILHATADHVWDGGVFVTNAVQLYSVANDGVGARLPFFQFLYNPTGMTALQPGASNQTFGLINRGNGSSVEGANPRAFRGQAVAVRMLIEDADDDPVNSVIITVAARLVPISETGERIELIASGTAAATVTHWEDGIWQLAGLFQGGGGATIPTIMPPSFYTGLQDDRVLALDLVSAATLEVATPGQMAFFTTQLRVMNSPNSVQGTLTAMSTSFSSSGIRRFEDTPLIVPTEKGIGFDPTPAAISFAAGHVASAHGRSLGPNALVRASSATFDPSPGP